MLPDPESDGVLVDVVGEDGGGGEDRGVGGDMTAAESVPMPTTATAGGQRYCSASGRMKLCCSGVSGTGPVYAVRFQSAHGVIPGQGVIWHAARCSLHCVIPGQV